LLVAVDGPSGLDYDTGELDTQALSVDMTVTFAFPKQGHFLFPGAGACGQLSVADIGIDAKLARDLLDEPALEVVTAEMVRALLPGRPRAGHKGTFGKALLVTGSINYTGAAYLAASGATRVGAGLVTLAVPAAIHGALAAKISEATYLILPQAMGIISPNAVDLLTENMEGYQAMLLGSGLTQEKEAVEFVHKLFQAKAQPKRRGRIGFQTSNLDEESDMTGEPSKFPPLVVDADGLNALAQLGDKQWWQRLPQPSILTPHPGEMARLMGVTTGEVQSDRLKTATEMAGRWGHVVLLKGAFTVVASPDGRTAILPFATSVLATAGTGDVLAGAVVGLLAQGLAPFDAAVAGAYLHGLAGNLAGEEIGLAGTVAGDLLPRLPRALNLVAGNP
jgi:NAD(P)H-hydrate epimerase